MPSIVYMAQGIDPRTTEFAETFSRWMRENGVERQFDMSMLLAEALKRLGLPVKGVDRDAISRFASATRRPPADVVRAFALISGYDVRELLRQAGHHNLAGMFGGAGGLSDEEKIYPPLRKLLSDTDINAQQAIYPMIRAALGVVERHGLVDEGSDSPEDQDTVDENVRSDLEGDRRNVLDEQEADEGKEGDTKSGSE